jgi:AcrR family transcriptional regulator
MLSTVGRPREHDDDTREALLGAAERIVEAAGASALSVRGVADAIGTTTRAVYSVFGSKEGLLNALARRSFVLLRDAISALPETSDPSQDLIDAAVKVFRPMAIEHPSMFALAFLRAAPDLRLDEGTRAASGAGLLLLRQRVQRLADAGLLGGRDVTLATAQFSALCQGMASTELRNPEFLGRSPTKAWRSAFDALVTGFATPPRR